MKTLAFLITLAALGANPGAAWAKGPVVVELFTAQGCASCKAANAMVAKMADRPGVLALTWPVDYWDYLGWKDTFAQPEFTARQKAFGRRLGPRDVYTPQVVVGGGAQASGDDAKGVETLIANAAKTKTHPPKVRVSAAGVVHVGSGRSPHVAADVWLVRYDPGVRTVEITGGDNRGTVVTLRNVAREVVRLGAWRGARVTLKGPPATEKGLFTAVIVEGARGGPIIAAAKARGR